MSKVRRHAAPEPSFADEDVSVASVVFGLVMIVALIVAAAALMGGSLSQMESRMANTTDAIARSVGVGVSTVRVVGLERDPVLEADVRSAAMIEPGENMFRADPHVIRARVEATRKVVNVRVHRLWPDQVVIMADPAQPLALFNDGEAWAVIDVLGREMAGASSADHAHLPRITGAAAPEAAFDLIASLGAFPALSDTVIYAERVAQRRWDLHLRGGAVAMLPRDAGLDRALNDLSVLTAETPALTVRTDRLDLRSAGQIYIAPASVPRSEGSA
ncbi:MAG: FtsQ-type POTRA domain-containing protein [Pseudomonadota bacterium]